MVTISAQFIINRCMLCTQVNRYINLKAFFSFCILLRIYSLDIYTIRRIARERDISHVIQLFQDLCRQRCPSYCIKILLDRLLIACLGLVVVLHLFEIVTQLTVTYRTLAHLEFTRRIIMQIIHAHFFVN